MRQAGKQELARALAAVRTKTLASFEHIDHDRLRVPQLDIVNLPVWELGHVGWVQEHWCLRYEHGQCVRDSVLPDADRMLNSATVDHAWRWDLALPAMDQVRSYLTEVLEKSLLALERCGEDDHSLYFHRLSYFHEVMHLEAFHYTWQTLGYPKPTSLPDPVGMTPESDSTVQIPAGQVWLGSEPDNGFVFDNEKWAMPVAVDAFDIDARPVSYGQFARFVDDGGYQNSAWWTDDAWQCIQVCHTQGPTGWRHGDRGWELYRFGRWIDLPTDQAVMHVSAHEARAYCRWAERRLPTEAQWTLAAQSRADFDWGRHVWEWTDTDFGPLPGFSPDPYKEYSEPWFGDHLVVKGGSFATERSLIDARFRNFYRPERSDPFIGFRTCS